jgi:DNA polymerase-3 subunit epsilon
MNFVAIDVETANADMASICQIGLVKYVNGVPAEEWKTYVDPEDYFDGINVDIHGIDEAVVRGAPTFAELVDTHWRMRKRLRTFFLLPLPRVAWIWRGG